MISVDTDVADERLRLAYEEGMRVLAQQRDDMERLRTRTVALVSVASLAAGFLGVGHDHLSEPWVVVGLVAFGALIVSVCIALLPRETIFENDPRIIVSGYVDAHRNLNETLQWLAIYAGDNAERNAKKLNGLSLLYAIGVIALGLLVASFAMALVVGK
jgi:hypothetical membrane protein